MKKLKLYLSKSNNCNLDQYHKIKEELSKYFEIYIWSYEFLESKEIQNMDLVLIILPKTDKVHVENKQDIIFVGRGQYEEIIKINDKHKIYVLNNYCIQSLQDFKINDTNDWSHTYGKCYLKGDNSLDGFIDNFYHRPNKVKEVKELKTKIEDSIHFTECCEDYSFEIPEFIKWN